MTILHIARECSSKHDSGLAKSPLARSSLWIVAAAVLSLGPAACSGTPITSEPGDPTESTAEPILLPFAPDACLAGVPNVIWQATPPSTTLYSGTTYGTASCPYFVAKILPYPTTFLELNALRAANLPPATTAAACAGLSVHMRVWGYTEAQIIGCEELLPGVRCPVRIPARWTLLTSPSVTGGYWSNGFCSNPIDLADTSFGGYDALYVEANAYETEAGGTQTLDPFGLGVSLVP